MWGLSSFNIFLLIVFLVAKALAAEDGYEVTQIHIAQGVTPESMTISWVTKLNASSQVKFGRTADNLESSFTGYTTSYDFNYPDFGYYSSGVIHHVTVTGLEASTLYFYQCGDFEKSSTSGLLTFKTMAKVGDHSPLHLLVVGDLGTTTDSETTLQHMMQDVNGGLILHAGDLSYADCNQTKWDQYGVMIESLSRER
jgi:acid phosphatase type 7